MPECPVLRRALEKARLERQGVSARWLGGKCADTLEFGAALCRYSRPSPEESECGTVGVFARAQRVATARRRGRCGLVAA
eukprot:2072010-Pleurochrysis_carterae.AAC.2